MAGRIEGKVAIITGGGSGLGRAGSLLFAQEGASVAVADINEAAAQATVDAIAEGGGSAFAARVDVVRLADLQDLVERTVQKYGKLDIMWNNAGVLQTPPSTPVEDTEEAEWDRVLAINLKGVFLGCKSVVPQMKKQGGGVIINTASLAGLKGQAVGMIAYTASKGGVVNMTRQLATELGPHNIRVNAVAPGTMRIPMLAPYGDVSSTFDEGKTDATRSVLPEEVAQTCLHLAADDTGPLTGTIVSIDGGRYAS